MNKKQTKIVTMKNSNKIFIELLTILHWAAYLLKADSYYIPYLIVGLVGFVACYFNVLKNIKLQKTSDKIITRCYCVFLSILIILANYKIFWGIQVLESGGTFFVILYETSVTILAFAGGYYAFKEILVFLYGCVRYQESKEKVIIKQQYTIKNWQVFLCVWIAIAMLDSIIMFGTNYPGILSGDSINQVNQILNHSYSNHHPYYYTQIIHIMISIGYRLFGNINAAVATYSFFSINLMAICFAYVVSTIFQWKQNLKITVVVFIWYLVMPFHIMYSFTMWKDVLFGAAVTFFIVALFRVLKAIGNHWRINYLIMIFSGLAMCLWRSNGWFSFVLSTIVFGILFRKKQRKILFLLGSIIIISYVLKHPVLKILNVGQPDTIESLSIPAQQVARVVADGKKLTHEQEELLSQVIDVNAIPEAYDAIISDPIKSLVRLSGNQDYIKENKYSFIKLYFQLGFTYPKEYIEAWIDQTRGYWNAGYHYWVCSAGVAENLIGIKLTVRSELIYQMLRKYLWMYGFPWGNSGMITSSILTIPWSDQSSMAVSSILTIFVCVGFQVWLVIISTYLCLIRRDYIAVFVSIPILTIVLSLLVATPVSHEFRYIYMLFCSLPFILISASGK